MWLAASWTQQETVVLCAVVLGCARLREPTEPTALSAQRAQGQGIGHAGDCLCGWVPVLLADLHGSKGGEQMKLWWLLFLLIAVPALAQVDGTTNTITQVPIVTDTMPTDYPTVGNVGCEAGYKLQRYSAGRPGNMQMTAVIPEHYGTAPGWLDVDAGPHEGDYRCVKAYKTVAKACVLGDPKPGDILVARPVDGCLQWESWDGYTINNAY